MSLQITLYMQINCLYPLLQIFYTLFYNYINSNDMIIHTCIKERIAVLHPCTHNLLSSNGYTRSVYWALSGNTTSSLNLHVTVLHAKEPYRVDSLVVSYVTMLFTASCTRSICVLLSHTLYNEHEINLDRGEEG